MLEPRTINVRNCARCDGDHDQIEAKPFLQPPSGWTHWVLCPRVGEPILVLEIEKDGIQTAPA